MKGNSSLAPSPPAGDKVPKSTLGSTRLALDYQDERPKDIFDPAPGVKNCYPYLPASGRTDYRQSGEVVLLGG